jgi:hypothetical protein
MSKEEDFHHDLMQNLLAEAGAEQEFLQSKFVENICNILVDQSVLEDFTQTNFKNTSKGYRVDAWSWKEETKSLYVVASDFRESSEITTISKTDAEKNFSRMLRFFEACRDESIAEQLGEAMPITELAWEIQSWGDQVKRINLILVTNSILSSRVKGFPESKSKDSRVIYDVWDVGRLFRLEHSGREKEEIEIDFTNFNPKGIHCLPAYGSNEEIKSYLLAIPGDILANLYENFGERLLEQNVRTFLQFRGNVNKGIRNTIQNEPEMFFSYNNGISATAEEVTTNTEDSSILKIRNLQIVNGGQTTAAIFNSLLQFPQNDKKVFVQVKLSVVDKEKVEVIVPRISEYANTQNKVNVADFFSNHPFHVRIEEFSRRLYAPSKEGTTIQTHWFYERARGQYANKQANLSKSKKKTFVTQNPRSQMFTKTDLAKFILSFDQLPYIVSRGAQKAFAGGPGIQGLVQKISKLWDKESSRLELNELWFKRSIAKAILFKGLDRGIFRAQWYSGYKSQIVTYSIAKFMNLLEKKSSNFDFIKIWELQEIPQDLLYELLMVAEAINDQFNDRPPTVTSNLGEWAKQERCWQTMQELEISLGDCISKYLITESTTKERESNAKRNQGYQDKINARIYVVEKGPNHWMKLLDWDNQNKKLSPIEKGILEIACYKPHTPPSDKQSALLIKAEQKAIREGFFVS